MRNVVTATHLSVSRAAAGIWRSRPSCSTEAALRLMRRMVMATHLFISRAAVEIYTRRSRPSCSIEAAMRSTIGIVMAARHFTSRAGKGIWHWQHCCSSAAVVRLMRTMVVVRHLFTCRAALGIRRSPHCCWTEAALVTSKNSRQAKPTLKKSCCFCPRGSSYLPAPTILGTSCRDGERGMPSAIFFDMACQPWSGPPDVRGYVPSSLAIKREAMRATSGCESLNPSGRLSSRIRSSPFLSPPPPHTHGMKGTPQAPPQNTVISPNFLPPALFSLLAVHILPSLLPARTKFTLSYTLKATTPHPNSGHDPLANQTCTPTSSTHSNSVTPTLLAFILARPLPQTEGDASGTTGTQ